jgi:flagellin
MALAIATNNAALQAAASASSVNRDMETSMARLSTGKRINSARDDAAGVAIASRLSSEIRGTDQAIRNAMDGQALIDTAEGGHSEIENVLQRMREVAIQSANDTNDLSDRQNLQAEIKALVTEIDRIASVTTWAGQTMMSDIGSQFIFQVGTATGDKNQIGIDIKAMSKTALGISGGAASGTINPISSAVGLFDDANTGMLSLNSQSFATPVSALIENVNVQIAPVMTAKLTAATATLVGTTNTTIGTTAGKEHTFKATVQTNVAASAASTVTIDGIAITTTATIAGGGTAGTTGTFTATLPEIHNQLALQINSSEEMQKRGISATVDATDGVVLAFADVYTNTNRVDNAASYAAKINNDPTFLAKGILAVAQTDAAVLGSNGTNNNKGYAQSLVFTGSSGSTHATLATSASAYLSGARFEVVGTDANGIAMSEMVIGGESNTAKTVQAFLTVTKITQIGTTDAKSLVSIGTEALLNNDGTTNIAADLDAVKSATLTASGTIQFGQLSANTMVNARVELLHGADDMSTAAKARHAVTVLDGAIKSVNTQRSNLGAISNRLSHTVSNLTNISSNLSAAKGGIEDADFALETTALAKNQILQQASTAMLAQANAAKQNVLSLLQG